MPMKGETHEDEGLEAFFDAARRHAPAPGRDMLARVVADAEAVQPAGRTPHVRRTGGERLRHLLGGFPAMAGLAIAALAGLWIGAGLPERLFGADDPAYLVDITPEMAFGLAGGADR